MGHMNIGIIGAGNIGGNLTRRLTTLGHKVSVANSHGPDSLWQLAHETGAQAVTVEDAVKNEDLIIVTIPEKSIPTLPKGLFDNLGPNVVVIDTGNYYPQQRDGRIAGIEDGLTESGWVEQQIGHPVIKAFNNIYAAHLLANGKPKGTPGRIALPVAGDDPKAKKIVMDLIDALGFDPVDDGTIADSWRQQPGTPVYAGDFDAAGVKRALGEANKERKPEWRAKSTAGVS
jgi:8-hydroxy-5-deazaflavin:NADPH oxidoreductase